MNLVEQALRRVDRYQQAHGWLGFPFGVVKKFGDDKGGNLTALLAWNGFFALFPLLLILVTVLGFLLAGHPALKQRVLHSALAQFPIIGDQLQSNLHGLHANTVGLVVGLAGVLWGARGLLLLVFALGVTATTALASLAVLARHSLAFTVANLAASAAVNTGLFLLAFRVLTPRQIPTRQLLLGAAVAGVLWVLLQSGGGYLVGHNLKHASQVYGFFAIVLGLLSWLYLAAEATLYAAEVNVVGARHLWPRSILQPPLTRSDKRALTDLAKQEERRPEESIQVNFTDQAQASPAEREPHDHNPP